MNLSSVPEVFAAQMIFLALLPMVLFAPLRWSVLLWLVMTNLDTTGPNSGFSGTVSWMNAVKSVGLPIYLLWRLRGETSQIWSSLAAKAWLGLAGYALIAVLWSPFPVAAVKLVGNMVGALLAFVVLEKAARRDLLAAKDLIFLIVVSLFLGVVQTGYYGGEIYGFDGAGQPTRFSSFDAAQQYAGLLVGFLVIVLWHPGFRTSSRVILAPLVCAALALNGSRTWVFGAVVVVLIYVTLSFRRAFAYAAFAAATLSLGILLVQNFNPMQAGTLSDTSSRVVATINAIATGQDNALNKGLANLRFRLAIYNNIVDEIHSAGAAQILWGRGTSSGGSVVVRVYPVSYKPDTVDANRAIHNEWLRTFYEWGIAGSMLLAVAFIAMSVGLVRAGYGRSRMGRRAILSFLPAFFIAFSSENLIAGAGSGVAIALAVIANLGWSSEVAAPLRKSVLAPVYRKPTNQLREA